MKTFILILIVSMISCSSADNRKSASGSEEAPEETRTSRPDTVEAEITLEGMTETMPMYLLESPESFPLDFSTYIPSDMETKTVNLDEGTAIRIMAAFGGQLNQDAHLTIYAFPPGTSAEKADALAEETAGSLGTTTQENGRYRWAKAVYSIKGEHIGFIALAQKNNLWFYLQAAYPPEYGDGMGPRINTIIDEWRWMDTNRPLE